MVRFGYLGKEYGIAKVVTLVLGIAVLSLGCHSHFSSAWAKRDVYKICAEIKNLSNNVTLDFNVDATCPTIILEKFFIAIIIFCFTLSTLGLLGNLFSVQFSNGSFKIADMAYNGISGVLLIIGGSLFLYSAVKINNLFNALTSVVIPCVSERILNETYQLYEEKLAAGSLSILQGLLYFVVAALMFLK